MATAGSSSAGSPTIFGLPLPIFISVFIGSALAIGTVYVYYGGTNIREPKTHELQITSGTASELYSMALAGELENGSYVIVEDQISDIELLSEDAISYTSSAYDKTVVGYVTFESDPDIEFLFTDGSEIEHSSPGEHVEVKALYYEFYGEPVFIII